MTRSHSFVAALTVFIVAVAPAFSEGPPEMVTDRPDQTESSVTVTPGRVQIETGWTHAEEASAGITASSDALPETLLRIGLTDWLEGRFIHGGYGVERVKPGGRTGSGLNDAAVGFKFHLGAEHGALPEIALNVHAGLPIAAAGRSSDRVDPDFRFMLAHSLPADFSLGYNAGAAWSTAEETPGDRDTTAVFEYTVTVGRGLGESWGIFVEVFGDAAFHGGPPTTLVDGGFTFSALTNLQFDLAGGVGLSETAEDWFGGVGISYRYPD